MVRWERISTGRFEGCHEYVATIAGQEVRVFSNWEGNVWQCYIDNYALMLDATTLADAQHEAEALALKP